ncbi:hypothetical protein AAG570_000560 [Ranatra chinensis]|uniref:Uncharacterized protein n=1 Tax=Ranatra chinensis TaxID=642074 RepID=A0ABD0YXF6_9HEMI
MASKRRNMFHMNKTQETTEKGCVAGVGLGAGGGGTAAAPQPTPPAGCPLAHFACSNGRCVTINKYCDGVNNCGDSSDEPKLCTQGHIYPWSVVSCSEFVDPNKFWLIVIFSDAFEAVDR